MPRTAGYRNFTSTQITDVEWLLTFHDVQVCVTFESNLAAANLFAQIDTKRQAIVRRTPVKVEGEDCRLSNCMFIGGATPQLILETNYTLIGKSHCLEIWPSPATAAGRPLLIHDLTRSLHFEISGPGVQVQGGGFTGGGFGVEGAVEGIVIASILNKLTSKTFTTTIIAVKDDYSEAFFLCTSNTPEEIRRLFSPLFVSLRRIKNSDAVTQPVSTPSSASPLIGGDLAANLSLLAQLHIDGHLSDEEYKQAKDSTLNGT